jgi:hypothetical protein
MLSTLAVCCVVLLVGDEDIGKEEDDESSSLIAPDLGARDGKKDATPCHNEVRESPSCRRSRRGSGDRSIAAFCASFSFRSCSR